MENIDQKIIDLKQEALRSIIDDFSQNFLEDLDQYIGFINLIYAGEFRHSYSDITAMLIKLNKENPQALEFVSYNFSSLVDKFPKEENSDAYRSLNKLYDHIILEQIRLKEVYSDSKELADNARKLSEQATELLNRANEIVKETISVKTELIAVLGIFAAILLAFVGGLTFSTSVFANLHQASMYRIVLAILLIGLVLINILYGLFYYIDRLVRRDEEDKKIKLLIITNGIILVLIVATILAWSFALVEKRNERINKQLTIYEIEENVEAKHISEKDE